MLVVSLFDLDQQTFRKDLLKTAAVLMVAAIDYRYI